MIFSVVLRQDGSHHLPQGLAPRLPEQGVVRPRASGETDRTGPGSPPGSQSARNYQSETKSVFASDKFLLLVHFEKNI